MPMHEARATSSCPVAPPHSPVSDRHAGGEKRSHARWRETPAAHNTAYLRPVLYPKAAGSGVLSCFWEFGRPCVACLQWAWAVARSTQSRACLDVERWGHGILKLLQCKTFHTVAVSSNGASALIRRYLPCCVSPISNEPRHDDLPGNHVIRPAIF